MGVAVPYWRLFYHLVWATKGRAPVLTPEMEPTLERSMRTTIDGMRGIPHAVGFMPDHVNVAASIPPSVTVADVVARLKGASSHAVNQAYPAAGFAWQADYGVLSFGEKNLPDVLAYVRDQPRRHADNRLWPTLERATDQPEPASAGLSG
jgi:putative transposase